METLVPFSAPGWLRRYLLQLTTPADLDWISVEFTALLLQFKPSGMVIHDTDDTRVPFTCRYTLLLAHLQTTLEHNSLEDDDLDTMVQHISCLFTLPIADIAAEFKLPETIDAWTILVEGDLVSHEVMHIEPRDSAMEVDINTKLQVVFGPRVIDFQHSVKDLLQVQDTTIDLPVPGSLTIHGQTIEFVPDVAWNWRTEYEWTLPGKGCRTALGEMQGMLTFRFSTGRK